MFEDGVKASFCLGFIFGAVLMGYLVLFSSVDAHRSELIRMGVAQYCPATGEFALKGECDK